MRQTWFGGSWLARMALGASFLAGPGTMAQTPSLQGCALLIPAEKRNTKLQLLAPQLSFDGKFVAYELPEGNKRKLYISNTADWTRIQVQPPSTSVFKSSKGYESELDWCRAAGCQSWYVFVTGEKDNLDIYLGAAADPNKPTIPLVNWPSNDSHPVLSPDGKNLAFTSTKDRREGADLYVILDIDKKMQDPKADLAPVRLTTSETGVLYPSWSPDSLYLSLTLEASENDVMNDGVSVLSFGKLRSSLAPGEDASAKMPLQRATGPEVWASFPGHDEVGASWSPDGSYLAFYMSAHSGGRKKKSSEMVEQSLGLVQVQRSGDELKFSSLPQTPLSDKALDPNVDSFQRGPVFSPDSKWLLLVKDSPAENNPIRILGVPGGEVREEQGTTRNRDLFLGRGADGSVRVVFSALDEETASPYQCELR